MTIKGRDEGAVAPLIYFIHFLILLEGGDKSQVWKQFSIILIFVLEEETLLFKWMYCIVLVEFNSI